MVRERRTKIQATSRPDHVWPEVWTKIGQAAQNREKQGAKEKPKLDDARRLRGFCFDPDDREHSEILKKCKKRFGNACGSSDAVYPARKQIVLELSFCRPE